MAGGLKSWQGVNLFLWGYVSKVRVYVGVKANFELIKSMHQAAAARTSPSAMTFLACFRVGVYSGVSGARGASTTGKTIGRTYSGSSTVGGAFTGRTGQGRRVRGRHLNTISVGVPRTGQVRAVGAFEGD